MNSVKDRIQYLTAKAQRGAITPSEKQELVKLLGKNPNDFKSNETLETLIGIGLIAIAISLLAEIFSGKK